MTRIIKSLAELLHGVAASAFILFSRALKKHEAAHAGLCPRAQPAGSQANVSSWCDFPTAPVTNSLPCLPAPSPLCAP